jgi:hypothetical protein
VGPTSYVDPQVRPLMGALWGSWLLGGQLVELRQRLLTQFRQRGQPTWVYVLRHRPAGYWGVVCVTNVGKK